MSTNFLQFDQNAQNILSDADYNANGQRINGVVPGLAQSALQNKFQYQVSTMVAAIAQSLSDAGQTVADSDLPGLITSINTVFIKTASTIAQTIQAASSTVFTTPASIGGLWIQGSNIASATTITIPASGGGYFRVTGTTTITGINEVVSKNGRAVRLVFDGILTLTHNATSLILPTGANITTAAGDSAVFVQEDASNNYWRCVDYERKDGTSLYQGIVTTKGDVLTYGTAPARQAVGTNLQVLTANSAATNGLEWATPIFSKGITSADQTITTGGTINIAHGLGAIPSLVVPYLKCTSTDVGYSVGDVVLAPLSNDTYGLGISLTASNVTLMYNNTATCIQILDKSTRNNATIDKTKWVAFVRAYV
jgi:hypothetical protein